MLALDGAIRSQNQKWQLAMGVRIPKIAAGAIGP
jgi:hypothetical protein